MTNKQVSKMPLPVKKEQSGQGELDLTVERSVEVEGIGMGVLSDGTPFLSQRGLARLCGVENRYIGIITSEWNASKQSERTLGVKKLLTERGEALPKAAQEASWNGRRVLAYSDSLCMAALEYYAFDAGLSGRKLALRNFRRLARFGFAQFIYARVGYDNPDDRDVWRSFRDRVSLTYDAVPKGYFGVFKELSSMIVTLGLEGLHIDERFVPDISVGKAWAGYWQEANLTDKYGASGSYPHRFPDYFPQAVSNPQMARCYPEDALGEFRRWFRNQYIGEGCFKRYLTRKSHELLLPDGYVERAVLALTQEE